MEILNDRVGEINAVKRLMRERLNARGDRVMLREKDAREVIESIDTLVDMLRRAYSDLDDLRRDNAVANHSN